MFTLKMKKMIVAVGLVVGMMTSTTAAYAEEPTRLPPLPDPLPPHWGEVVYSCAHAFGNCDGRPYREKAIASYFYTGASYGWDNPETFERAAWAATATESVYELYGEDAMDMMVGLP